MTVIQFALFLLFFVALACVAYWLICKFAPEPARMWVLAFVGLLLLVVLLAQFMPEAGNYRVFR